MSAQSTQFRVPRAWVQYGGLLFVLVVVISAGYLGFRTFATTPTLSSANLYLFAVVAGVASFFSPCAFPLLPSYFSFYQTAGRQSVEPRSGTGEALRCGLAAAFGVVTFALILGAIITVLGTGVAQGLSISGPEPSQFVRGFRGVIGAILLTLGFGQLVGWNLKPRFVDAFAFYTRPKQEGKRGPAVNLYLYGLGYNAAGMGCTGPILAGLIVVALASGGLTSALGAFFVFAVTMGALMLFVSLLVAASEETLITRMKAAAPTIKRASSYVLILVGAFNIYTAINLSLFLALLFPSS
ncbi:MAG: cytochrome c biogenesis CcdA family protein [Anaerolineales bacterium]